MARNAEYQKFLDFMNGKIPDEFPENVEVPATAQDIGWIKKRQVQLAIHNKRKSEATLEQLRFLSHKVPLLVVTERELTLASRRQY